MAGWDTLRALVQAEFRQSREEGKDPATLAALWPLFEAAGEDESMLLSLHEELVRLPVRADFGFDEPSDLPSIRARCSLKLHHPELRLDDDQLFDALHGAWLGRCVGCALGKPVEAFMGSSHGLASWERQKRYLTAIASGEWPLRDYFPATSPAIETTGRLCCPASTRERIAALESDDAIRYTLLGQIALREFGPAFTSSHIAQLWFGRLAYRQLCTAETQSYRNMVARCDDFRHDLSGAKGRAADEATDWEWVVQHLNPYREWIGAQIRVDSYGYAAPGHPRLAAEFAWRDARISHVKNGIYGAMLCAAMIAAAFKATDVRAVIEAGLGEIPRTSRLYADIRHTIAICERHECDFVRFENVIAEIYALLGHYHPVHTNNNAALCVAALLLSGGDFERGITLAVMGGWDTDCNGATVGSIVGAMTGARRAPAHWTARLNDTLHAEMVGYHPIAISECARRSLEICRAVGAAV